MKKLSLFLYLFHSGLLFGQNQNSLYQKYKEAVIEITLGERTFKSFNEKKKGLGIFVSKDGEFIVNRTLVQDAIKYTGLYHIKIENHDGQILTGLKLSKCGLTSELDICLMKVDYSPLHYFKTAEEKSKAPGTLKAIVKDEKGKWRQVEAKLTSYTEMNFLEYFILKMPGIQESFSGAPLFNKKGELLGQLNQVDERAMGSIVTHALSAGEIELFLIQNRIFYPLPRSKETNFFLSDLEKLLREKKQVQGTSRSDLKKMRLMESTVQKFWPSYLARIDARGVQELKKNYEAVSGLGKRVTFDENRQGSTEEKAKRIMAQRSKVQEKVSETQMEIQNIEMEINKKNPPSQLFDKQIKEIQREIGELKNKSLKNKNLVESKTRQIKGMKDLEMKKLIEKGILITKENIVQDKNRIAELKRKLSALEKNRKNSKKSRSPIIRKYQNKLKELEILKGKVKNLDEKASEFFEDAI